LKRNSDTSLKVEDNNYSDYQILLLHRQNRW